MHVGPTNSGKTHNALRALAAADTGVYAGPLRLLAHEIWQRLNSGQIPPLGVDPNVSSSLSDPEELADSALDMAHEASDMRQRVNPEWVRPCNLITGEECRIVGPDAMLTSCTVEMLDYTSGLDVGVVDEIQMIGDELRGSAWTDAVLGLAVRELHLCGEETAVPLVRKLLEPTGDTLVINRYERLTPLVVEEKSLNGDLSRVQKGDCVVAFSRKDIFSLSNAIRSATNMRCAVVYGALPPETRSSQAALFNNPDSGYDVLVGSDAIGMGLNLKIRRVIFQRLGKWDGIIERSLTVSQTKQIAGRAGRFGLGDGSAGYVTTLYEKDLPVLRSLMSQTPPVLVAARLGYDLHRLRAVTKMLPPSASVATVYTALKYTADVASQFAMQEASSLNLASNVLDKYQKALIPDDVDNFMLAPFPWRNDNATPQIRNLIASYLENHHVGIRDMVRGTALIESLQRAEQRMAAGGRPWQGLLPHMERFHKLLVTYLWLALRNPVIYSDVSWCVDLKERVEGVLDWNLRLLSKADNDQPLPPTPSSGIDYQPHAFIVRAQLMVIMAYAPLHLLGQLPSTFIFKLDLFKHPVEAGLIFVCPEFHFPGIRILEPMP
ncbi:hypothetical protein FISHEDRAFT_67765 [Fistulina hepatica ATCC 64428]|nr:hypothetical protein FISHEDRAFT_67765 [Fistulina hepatica ATCC 64428]